ncbi:MAG: GreA/GreB family elongation factor [Microbacterium enclense]
MALDEAIRDADEKYRAALSGTHESTTQTSETWHDNPAFDAVQQDAKMWYRQKMELEEIRKNAIRILPGATEGEVQIGSTVVIEWEKSEEQETVVIGSYIVLGAREGRISYVSPLASVLLGANVGSRREVGERRTRIKVISIA